MHVLIESPFVGSTTFTALKCECGLLFGVIDNQFLSTPDHYTLTDILWRHRQHALLQSQIRDDAKVLMWDETKPTPWVPVVSPGQLNLLIAGDPPARP